MAREVRPDEISNILKQQLQQFEQDVDVYDSGTVLEVGDGIARVHGLANAMASEMIEFPNDIFGIAFNLEEDNVGCVLFRRRPTHTRRRHCQTDRTARRSACR